MSTGAVCSAARPTRLKAIRRSSSARAVRALESMRRTTSLPSASRRGRWSSPRISAHSTMLPRGERRSWLTESPKATCSSILASMARVRSARRRSKVARSRRSLRRARWVWSSAASRSSSASSASATATRVRSHAQTVTASSSAVARPTAGRPRDSSAWPSRPEASSSSRGAPQKVAAAPSANTAAPTHRAVLVVAMAGRGTRASPCNLHILQTAAEPILHGPGRLWMDRGESARRAAGAHRRRSGEQTPIPASALAPRAAAPRPRPHWHVGCSVQSPGWTSLIVRVAGPVSSSTCSTPMAIRGSGSRKPGSRFPGRSFRAPHRMASRPFPGDACPPPFDSARSSQP